MGRATTAMLVAMFAAAAAAAPPGVCYSPFHSAEYFSAPSAVAQVLARDMQQIASVTPFASVRTYHAQFYGESVADAARAAGLQVAIGIQMVGADGGAYAYLEQDIAAAVAAATTHPDSVLAIYAGNENLANGDFGSSSASDIARVITRVKSALRGTKGAAVPVGTVQRLEEWLHAPNALELAAAADVLGVNIYPFFTAGGERDMAGTLDASWALMTAKYGTAKARLTETGWPTQGSVSAAGNTPSLANAQQYYAAFRAWAAATSSDAATPFYFMMYDDLTAQNATDYEQHFGLSTAAGALKFDLGAAANASASASTVASSSNVSLSKTSSATTASSSKASAALTTPALNTNSKSAATSDQGEDAGDEVAGEADRSLDDVATAATTSSSNSDSSSAGDDGSSFLGMDFVAGVGSPITDEPADSTASTEDEPAGSAASTEDAGTANGATTNDTISGTVSSGSGSGFEDITISASSSSADNSSSSAMAPVKDDPDVGDLEPAPVMAPDLGAQTFAPVPTTSASKAAEEELKAQEAQAKREQDISGNQDSSMLGGTAVVGFLGVAAVVVIAIYAQKSRSAESTISITTADARESTPSVYSDPLGTRFSSIVMITPNGDGVCIL